MRDRNFATSPSPEDDGRARVRSYKRGGSGQMLAGEVFLALHFDQARFGAAEFRA